MHKKYTDQQLLDLANDSTPESLPGYGKCYEFAHLVPHLIDEILEFRRTIEGHNQNVMERDLNR